MGPQPRRKDRLEITEASNVRTERQMRRTEESVERVTRRTDQISDFLSAENPRWKGFTDDNTDSDTETMD